MNGQPLNKILFTKNKNGPVLFKAPGHFFYLQIQN